MPKCKNDPKRTYKGTEPSPKGLGYCAHSEKVGKKRKGKDGNQWIVKQVKTSKRWMKIKSTKDTTKGTTKKQVKKESKNTSKKTSKKSKNLNNKKTKKLDKKLIKIPSYSILSRYKVNTILNSINISHYEHHIKFLKLKKNYTNDDIIDKLTSKTIHNKIVKKLTDYNKIPISILDYYKSRLNDMTYEEIINKLLEYLHIQYNNKSIFDFDVGFIVTTNKYTSLNEEGPRDYLFSY
jgi:hypothetical protein